MRCCSRCSWTCCSAVCCCCLLIACSLLSSNGAAPHEPIELCWSIRDVALAGAGGLEQSRRQHASTKRVLVELFAAHRLVDLLQLAQGELRGQQLETDGRVIELAAQALHGEP